jgi:hypothetical protein
MNACRVGYGASSQGTRPALVRRWAGGTKNGELLGLAAPHFDVFLTVDRGLGHQQNLGRIGIAAIMLISPSNRYEDLRPLIPAVLAALETIKSGELVRIDAALR